MRLRSFILRPRKPSKPHLSLVSRPSHPVALPCRLSCWIMAGALSWVALPRALADGNGAPGGIAGVAAAEAQRRQAQVETAQTLFTAGSRAYADQSYAEAMDYFKAAFETVPDVPAAADQRRVFFDRYQAASYRYAQILASEARWDESEKTLAEVVSIADDTGVPPQRIDPELRKMLKDLRDRDDRYNFAATPRHLRDVDRVETKLVIAKGYRELGDYDRAERAYNEVLAIDPHNTAARRGLEQVERLRMNYQDAAYDHTRAKQLGEVAAGWETPVPLMLREGDLAGLHGVAAADESAVLGAKLNQIVIPAMEFNEASLADVVDFLVQKAQELDASETDPTKRGVNIVIDSSGPEGGDAGRRTLSVKLSNVPLAVALRYATSQVGMTYRVDRFAVRIVPPSTGASTDGALSTRTWIVPPGFLSGEGGTGGEPAAASANPFANPDRVAAGGAALVRRITAQQFLEDRGVQFGPGASANFVVSSNTLMVRNTGEQMQLVDSIVQAAMETSPKNIEIHVRMVSIGEEDLRQAGLDILLGQGGVGSSDRIFFGGGTDGNAFPGTLAADFAFLAAGVPVGFSPVTSGLRTGDVSSNQTIDSVMQRSTPTPIGKAPGIFSVAGILTDPQFQVVLRALSQLKGADLLADSHVVVRPGVRAKMEVIREFIYPTEYDPPEIPNQIGGSGYIPVTPATPTAFETRNLGKTIEVEANVAPDNTLVDLSVLLDFTDFSGFINYGTPIQGPPTYAQNAFGFPIGAPIPTILTENEILMPVFDAVKETSPSIAVWDGQTVVIGGFHGESVTSTEDKIPYIGDLPVLGRAFRSRTKQAKKRALTIFVSVRLRDPGGNPVNMPVEEEVPSLMTRRDPIPATTTFAPGPPPEYPSK